MVDVAVEEIVDSVLERTPTDREAGWKTAPLPYFFASSRKARSVEKSSFPGLPSAIAPIVSRRPN